MYINQVLLEFTGILQKIFDLNYNYRTNIVYVINQVLFEFIGILQKIFDLNYNRTITEDIINQVLLEFTGILQKIFELNYNHRTNTVDIHRSR